MSDNAKKSLVLAEKPSVGKDLARVLGCKRPNKGYIEGDRYVVTWALGHLVTLAEPGDYFPEWKQWRLDLLPMLPDDMRLKVMKQSRGQFTTVAKLLKRRDVGELIIATDAGREGELVARWIARQGGWKGPMRRLWISSQTDTAIRAGFATLKPARDYDNLYQAAQARAEADWVIGLNITRALTTKFDARLNAGRVQTPTLRIMVDRERAIQEFKPQPYWRIRLDMGDFVAAWQGKHGGMRISDKAKADQLASRLRGTNAVVADVESKSKTENPPQAYDLTELQREANRRYGFSAKHTLGLVQTLYERHKLVTYPRTDSRCITTDMVPTLPARIQAVAAGTLAGWAKPLLGKPLNPGKHLVNNAAVSDHHALLPTEVKPRMADLSTDERRVYELIALRMLAALYPPARFEQVKLTLEAAGESFIARGKVMREQGWRALPSGPATEDDDDDSDQPPEQALRRLNKGEKLPVKQVRLEEQKTKPPSRYTEATLLSVMEQPGRLLDDATLRASVNEGGLGTPATRADIIEKLIGGDYVERHGRALIPTPKAFELMSIVPELLQSPALTARWEMRLSAIATGKETRQRFMEDIRRRAGELVGLVRASNAEYKPSNLTREKCPLCGKPMLAYGQGSERRLVCSDRHCGHEISKGKRDGDGMRTGRGSRKEHAMNQKLIRQYSDNKSQQFGASLGDLFGDKLDGDSG